VEADKVAASSIHSAKQVLKKPTYMGEANGRHRLWLTKINPSFMWLGGYALHRTTPPRSSRGPLFILAWWNTLEGGTFSEACTPEEVA